MAAWIRVATLLVFALATVVAGARPAWASGTLRTVLVVDASSSMLSTDPKRLRKVGAEMLVDLARDGDQIAVTGFDGGVRESTGAFTTIQGPADREALKRAVRAVGENGAWTDFTAGLAEAKRLLDTLPDEPGDRKIIVFLTDGRCDPDPKGPLATAPRAPGVRVEEACQRKVADEIVPSLGRASVYAIGLSRSAPRAFLEELGRRTGGAAVATDTADELPRLFADVYARMLGSKLVDGAATAGAAVPLAVEEGTLTLDVIVKGPPTLDGTLADPKGGVVARTNERPREAYFVGADGYRLYKVARPAVGTWTLTPTGAGAGRWVALMGMELELRFVDPPEVAEIGKPAKVRVRLATPGGKVPAAAFLARHELTIRAAEAPKDCLAVLALGKGVAVPVKPGADGVYEVTLPPSQRGELCFEARLQPGPDGVLSRLVQSPVVRVVPPLRLVGAPVAIGRVKQGERGRGTLSLEGSEIGEPIEAKVSLVYGDRVEKETFELDVDEVKLAPKGERAFPVKLGVDRDAKPGHARLAIRVQPVKPRGWEERAIEVAVELDVEPLSFWERYGFWIEVGAGALSFLVLLVGFVAPARFRKGTVLVYEDVRDRDLPREATYPLAARAKAGFYRGARQRVGPTGPVKTGGVVELSPGGGGGLVARPLVSGKVLELPRKDDAAGPSGSSLLAPVALPGGGEGREVPVVGGVFRAAAGARYEIVGSGLVFGWRLR